MKFVYPAVLKPEENGRYSGYFPDLEGCQFRGGTLYDALDDARDALEAWIRVELEDNGGLPPTTDRDDMSLAPGEFVREIGAIVRLTDGWDE